MINSTETQCLLDNFKNTVHYWEISYMRLDEINKTAFDICFNYLNQTATFVQFHYPFVKKFPLTVSYIIASFLHVIN